MARKVGLGLVVGLMLGLGWNEGVSAAPSYNPITAGLVAAYEFTGNADDVSGNGNDGMVHGATLTADRFGNAGSAYSFDGVDDYIDLGAQNFGSSVSISLWVNFHQVTAMPQALINKYDGYTGSLDATIDRTLNLYVHGQGEGRNNEFYWAVSEEGVSFSERHSSTRAIESQWYYLASTFDNGAAEIYVNGVREASWSTSYGTLFASAVNLILGTETTDHPDVGGNPLNGTLDDLYIYNRALSLAEVQTLYSVVPEPSTAFLLITGLLGLVIRREHPRS